MKGVKREARALIRYAESLGFTASLTAKGHVRFSKPGCCPVFSGSTPGDHRSHKNAMSTLRKSHEGLL